MDILNHIRDYIIFLKQTCKLYISIHPAPEKETLISSGDLMRFNFHENSYCSYIKQSAKIKKHCADCQKKVFAKCGTHPFNGVCFAGVQERIYPITSGKSVTGFISVSGYTTDNASSYFQRLSEKYGFSISELTAAYNTLAEKFPEEEYLDTLLYPLCHMLELAYKNEVSPEKELSFAEKLLRYIQQYHNQNITSQNICKHFACCRTYMSTEFNRYTGKTIRQYINELRISDAKNLLENTNMTVTEIAFTVGFSSSAYFSELFKTSEGSSPLQYRKNTSLT